MPSHFYVTSIITIIALLGYITVHIAMRHTNDDTLCHASASSFSSLPPAVKNGEMVERTGYDCNSKCLYPFSLRVLPPPV